MSHLDHLHRTAVRRHQLAASAALRKWHTATHFSADQAAVDAAQAADRRVDEARAAAAAAAAAAEARHIEDIAAVKSEQAGLATETLHAAEQAAKEEAGRRHLAALAAAAAAAEADKAATLKQALEGARANAATYTARAVAQARPSEL